MKNQLDFNVYWDEDEKLWTGRWILTREGMQYGNLIHLTSEAAESLEGAKPFDLMVSLLGDNFFDSFAKLVEEDNQQILDMNVQQVKFDD